MSIGDIHVGGIKAFDTFNSSVVQRVPVRLNGDSGTLVPNPASVLADAQEEMPGMISGNRSVSSLKPRISTGVVSSNVELATRYLDGINAADMLEGGTNDRMLQTLKEAVRRGASEENANRILDDLLEEFSSNTPHDNFAQLVNLRKRNKESPGMSSQVNCLLSQRISSVTGEDAAVVRAGFNIDAKSREAEDLGKRDELTAMYVDVVVKAVDLGNIYRDIISSSGRENFADAIKFLISAAGDDMDSKCSSVCKESIESTVNSLHKLQTLSTVEESCYKATEQIKSFLKPDIEQLAFFEALLSLYESPWPMAASVHEQCVKVVVDEPQAKVGFHNQICNISREIPSKAFQDPRARDNLLAAVHGARDEAVAVEEKEVLSSS